MCHVQRISCETCSRLHCVAYKTLLFRANKEIWQHRHTIGV